jgi:radical SAM superfamily enzyme
MNFPVISETAARYESQTMPRLTMEEYCELVEALISSTPPEMIERQRALRQKQNIKAFRLEPGDSTKSWKK